MATTNAATAFTTTSALTATACTIIIHSTSTYSNSIWINILCNYSTQSKNTRKYSSITPLTATAFKATTLTISFTWQYKYVVLLTATAPTAL